MSEQVVVRFRYPDGEERTHIIEVDSWPLPDTLDDQWGRFRKASESQLPKPAKGVLRGAVYKPEQGGQADG